ncbi:MAG TPA: hypothetical protein VMC09_16630 [Anaerolineales bacterium]|nr:hypothetical protein [Anaerolineales bacterium]
MNNSWPNFYGAILVVGIGVVFLAIYALASVLAATTIVRGTCLADQGIETFTFVDLFRGSRDNFWKVIGLYAIFGGAFLLVVGALWALAFLVVIASMGVGLLCLIPLFFLLLPVNMLGAAFLELAKAAVVADGLGIGAALKRAWGLFGQNFWNIVLVAVILDVGMYVFSFILILPLYALMFIPLWAQLGQDGMQVQDPASNMFSSMRWIYLIVMPFYMVIVGILQTFLRTTWAATYLRLVSASSPVQPLAPAVAEPG